MRYVIIGGGAAGVSAAGAIRELDSKGSITILSEENHPPYFRPMIPFVISGEKAPSDIMLKGRGGFPSDGIDLRLNVRAQSVNTNEQSVSVADGDEIVYDKLLIATGHRAIIPPGIEGGETEGVFNLRTLAHAESMARRARSAEQAVMLGAGLLNLKASIEMINLGLEVTLVEKEVEVLPRIMDASAGAIIHEALSSLGVKVITGCTVVRILSDEGGVTGVLLDDGQEVPCQLVCIGVGGEPNVGFLEGGDVRVEHGVVADRFMSSSIENVFAAGDVAATLNPVTGEQIVTGLWTNAVEMGRCAGQNMAGRRTRFPGAFAVLNASQVADVPFVSMGLIHTGGTDYETHVSVDGKSYRKTVFTPDGSRLIGAIFVGEISRAGLYRYLIREGGPVDDLKSEIVGHRLTYGHFLRHQHLPGKEV